MTSLLESMVGMGYVQVQVNAYSPDCTTGSWTIYWADGGNKEQIQVLA